MANISTTIKNLVKPVAINSLLAWEYLESGVTYNPNSKSVQQNPYDTYEKLRLKDPVHRMRLMRAWTLVRYEDVDTVLRNHKQFLCEHRNEGYTEVRSMLDFDPPQHTRIRSLVSKAFTARRLAELEPAILKASESLIDEIGDRKSFDLIDEIAHPLPVIVIAKMLGVPTEDMDRFKSWSDIVAMQVEPILDDANILILNQGMNELLEYFEEKIEERRSKPRNDILSALIKAEEDGDRLSRDELLGTLILLLVAGNETTRNLIGNGMHALLKHPDQMQWLRDNPNKIDVAVTEMLRYDSPVQLDSRMVKEDFELHGKQIRAGDMIICVIGAANRDPDVFVNSNQLDFSRPKKAHLAFGRGIHYCLGSVLAMVEARAVFKGLLARFPNIRLQTEPKRRERVALRGLKELWVEVSN